MLKIVSLRLIHFSRILSGLNKQEIFLNLENITEKICLFIGKNGTGKSSILRCLHPFAYNNILGTSEVNSDIIQQNKDGRKEIVYNKDGHILHIVHTYTRKKNGITVKSFISKDGIELNENGISATFKEIVERELGITETFLTLLSISNSVIGIVEYTSSERKEYMTKIFSELNLYNQYYKDMTVLARTKKTLLSNVITKIQELGPDVTRESLMRETQMLEKTLSTIRKEKSELDMKLGSLQSQIDRGKDILMQHNSLTTKESELSSTMKSLKDNVFTAFHKNEIIKKQEETQKEQISLTIEHNTIAQEIKHILDQQDTLMKQSNQLKIRISKLMDKTNIESLYELKDQLSNRISEIEKMSPAITGSLTKEELIKANVYLDGLFEQCSGFLSVLNFYNKDNVIKIVGKYLKDNGIKEHAKKEYYDTASSIHNLELFAHTKLTKQYSLEDETPCEIEKENSCPYKKFFDEYIESINRSYEQQDIEIKLKQDKLYELERRVRIYEILENIFHYIKTKEDIFNKIPNVIFDPDTFIITYITDRFVYEDKILAYAIHYLEETEELDRLKEKKNNISYQIENYEKSKALFSELEKEDKMIQTKIFELAQKLHDKEKEHKRLSGLLYQRERELETLKHDCEIWIQIENLSKDLSITQKEINKIQQDADKIILIKETLEKNKKEKQAILLKEEYTNNLYNETNIKLQTLLQLEKDEESLRADYNDILLIQKAVSPTKGIPVKFLEYMMRIEMVGRINKLLQSVYGNNFKLMPELMTINSDEFTIPYKKGNTIIRDISKASDGERAILTMAFSLVLIQITAERMKSKNVANNTTIYNVMLLDEIDRPLDQRSRVHSLDMIEQYMSSIRADQLFLCSHSNTFDSYPVHVFMTSEYQIQHLENIPNASITKLYL